MEAAQCTMHCAVWSRLSLLRSRVRFLTKMEVIIKNGNGAVHDALRRLVSAFFIAISCAFSDKYGGNHQKWKRRSARCSAPLSLGFLYCDLVCVF